MGQHVGPNPNCTLIAEIGINHNGDMAIAKKLIDIAAKNEWDYVKFQKRDIDVVYTAEYLAQPRKSPWGTTQRDQKSGLEFGLDEFKEIDRYCKEKGIGWFASPWDSNSLAFLNQFDCEHQKVASAMLTNVSFLKEVASLKKHTYVSTGMSLHDDIARAVQVFREAGCPFMLMHSVSTYPCPQEEANIALMQILRERYDCPVGYSGHEAGTAPTLLAAALGAEAIERHITLDRSMYGSDQSASLESRGMEVIGKFVHSLPAVYGDGEKRVDEKEQAIARKLRYFEDAPG